LIEFSPGVGEENVLLFNEAYIYFFEAVPMIIAIGLLAVVHPGFAMQGEDSEFPRSPSRKEKKEEKARQAGMDISSPIRMV
jgi:hypothetical protein